MYKFAHGVSPPRRRSTPTRMSQPWPTTPPPRRTPSTHDPNIGTTGLDNRKMGMWIFLGSDCMFFGSLIGTYLAYKGKSLSGPTRTTSSTSRSPPTARRCCCASSLTMVLALAASAGEPRQGGGGLAARDRRHGPALRAQPGLRVLELRRPRGAHAVDEPVRLHVLRAHRLPRRPRHPRRRLALDPGRARPRGASSTRGTTPRSRSPGLYWHFVDIVWIAIFTIIYLIP